MVLALWTCLSTSPYQAPRRKEGQVLVLSSSSIKSPGTLGQPQDLPHKVMLAVHLRWACWALRNPVWHVQEKPLLLHQVVLTLETKHYFTSCTSCSYQQRLLAISSSQPASTVSSCIPSHQHHSIKGGIWGKGSFLSRLLLTLLLFFLLRLPWIFWGKSNFVCFILAWKLLLLFRSFWFYFNLWSCWSNCWSSALDTQLQGGYSSSISPSL